MNYRKVTLTRDQIERIAVMLALTESIERVTIEETNETGIGASHWAVYHTNKIERDFEQEITDVGAW